MFAVYCDSVATYWACRAAIGADFTVKGSVAGTSVKNAWCRVMLDAANTMRAIGAKFGLTPSDRAGIDISEQDVSVKYGPERILG
jgi:phage terminase small subunit